MGRIDTEELRSTLIDQLTREHAVAIRAKAAAGDAETLHDLGNAVGDRLSQPGVSELMIQTALRSGTTNAGAMVLALVEKCIDADAELEALKEVEQIEAAASADPDNYRPTMRQQRALDAMRI